MKTIITTIFCLFLAYMPTQAQTFKYTTDQHITDVFSDQGFVYYDINMVTPEPETITFRWQLISNGLPSNWNYSLCDHGNCYVGIASSGTMHTISKSEMEEGVEGYFKFNINPKSYGGGIVQIYVYDKDDYNRGDTVSINVYNRDLVNVELLDGKEISAYPNPVDDLLNIAFEFGGDKNLKLFNSSGELVSEMQSIAQSLQINTQEFESGIYYLIVQTEEGVRSQMVSILH